MGQTMGFFVGGKISHTTDKKQAEDDAARHRADVLSRRQSLSDDGVKYKSSTDCTLCNRSSGCNCFHLRRNENIDSC